MPTFKKDVGVIGGGGHVGLPLALTFANVGKSTLIYDINAATIDKIKSGQMPFDEEGGAEALKSALASGRLDANTTGDGLEDCAFVILIIGTPVDEHLNPTFHAIHRAIDACERHLRDGQILILRSTVFPGITQHIQQYVSEKGLKIQVAFCPERVAQGYSLREFRQLPQIISAFDKDTLLKVRGLFEGFTPEFIEVDPLEAELAKLMTNSWRYIQFATVNQFYMIATQNGVDFNRILHACRHNYPRMAGMPGPGFAAGPCLVKDTMQLAAFSQNNFVLGHAAMLVNEGLPAHLLSLAVEQTALKDKTCAILGMAFKAESDDSRDSLSYKLRKLLSLKCQKVLCADPYVKDTSFVPQEKAIAEAEVIFIGTPHKRYKGMQLPQGKTVVDVWNCVAPTGAKN